MMTYSVIRLLNFLSTTSLDWF